MSTAHWLQGAGCVDPDPGETVAYRINALLRYHGPGFVVRLCPGKRYYIRSPLVFAAPNQEISTEGYPLGDERATLVVSGSLSGRSPHTVAVDATQPDCTGVMLRNIQIDGNRKGAAPLLGGANIEFGVNDHQTIQYVKSYDPRSWSCLHVNEGPLTCTNTTVQHNDIGPCGSDVFDQWADGISVSCRSSTVRHNLVKDATDGGIVIYGSPGTLVYDNTIWVTNKTLLGGINMVDYLPWGVDFTNTVVKDNIIIGGYADPGSGSNAGHTVIKVGIAVGPRTWFGDKSHDNMTFAGTVVGNRLSGAFTYGIAVSSAEDFMLKDNVMFDNYTFIGRPGDDCLPEMPPPTAFIYDTTTSRVSVQRDFQLVLHGDALTCMLPPTGGDYWPHGIPPSLARASVVRPNSPLSGRSTDESSLPSDESSSPSDESSSPSDESSSPSDDPSSLSEEPYVLPEEPYLLPDEPYFPSDESYLPADAVWTRGRVIFVVAFGIVLWYLWRRRRKPRATLPKRTYSADQLPVSTEVLPKRILYGQDVHLGKRRAF
ncbi:hypothetical protein FB451DRAFT_477500 [Mycena latifolia]|nr:hypothetical protein FB451DRAFT_477500 [Mycena latifolia]